MRLSMADAGCNGTGVAQGQIEHRPEVLLKLGTHVALDGVVSAVVRAGRHFVHPKAAIAVQKHLHGQQSHEVHGRHHLEGQVPRVGFLLGRDRGRGHEVVHQVDFRVEHRLHHGVHGRLSLGVAGHDDAQLLVDVHRLLQDTRRVESPGLCVFGGVQDLNALPVVAALPEFLDDGKPHGANFLQAFDELVRGACDAPSVEGLLLKAFVLNQAQMRRSWHHFHALVGQPLQPFHAHVLDFHGDGVEPLPERHHGVGVFQIGLHKTRGQVLARRLRAGVHHFHADVPVHRLLDHHASELPAAQHAQTQCGADWRQGGIVVLAHAAKIPVATGGQRPF